MKTIKDIAYYFHKYSNKNTLVTDLNNDTRKLKKHSCFILDKTNEKYFNENDKRIDYLINTKDIFDFKYKELKFYAWFYNLKLSEFHFIGVTGTNGKSSTSYILHKLIKNSWLFSNVDGIKNSTLIKNTTPYPLEFIKGLRKAKAKNKKIIIIELSSIAMKEERLCELDFDFIILLNLYSDHLDYHKTLENYYSSKIDYINKYAKFAILNNNLKDKFKINTQFRYFDNLNLIRNKNECLIKFDKKTKIILPNQETIFLENYSAVYNLLKIVNKRFYKIRKIKRIKPIKGRMMVLKKHPLVIIDYPHTSSAFEKSLMQFKKRKGRLIAIFGCGGNRDISKRRVIGELALKYADIPIVTEDNSRNENIEDIIKDIVGKDRKDFITIKSRPFAIQYAFKIAKKEDIILVLGKGHEKTIIRKYEEDYSDIDEVKKWI
ncbi:MAG: Mur ligase family protein [Bacilli bacterium]